MSFKTVQKTVTPEPFEETVFVCQTCGHEAYDEEDAHEHQLCHVDIQSRPGPGCELYYCPVDDEALFRKKLEASGYRRRVSTVWSGPGWYAVCRDEWEGELYDAFSVAELVRRLKEQIEFKQSCVTQLEALNSTKGEVK